MNTSDLEASIINELETSGSDSELNYDEESVPLMAEQPIDAGQQL